ncbi:hypothetical protein N7516_007983 [Penicillium verrucosum]|uniref:uncharacterized protein n=1 Tax=Penicillium verrucosum TaxID=60171 RepID=UPI002544EEA4|nr:uncharacterized protein N7516_007983 [Penicillium verrucosum]KAJ5926210.1 hypothetical protein N7516_007983 [Penicillium verrucosum]
MDNDKAQSSAFNGDGNTITRCSLSNCTINNSCVKRSTLSDCVLSKVEDVSRVTAQKSQFYDAALAERSAITNSTIQTQSSVDRSTIGQSVIQDKSAVKRSTVTGTMVSNSQLQRTTLTNCVVTECIIERCDFQGLVLKYGNWKRNELVGKIGNQDPIFIRNYGSKAGQSAPVLVGSIISELDSENHPRQDICLPSYHVESDAGGNSPGDSGLDLPPPYRP